jgi:antitoxin MazE
MRVSKWGNSLAIRLPQAVVDVLELKEGDEIEINVKGKGVVDVDKKPSTKELLDRIKQYRGTLPKDFKFDRIEANERPRK